MTSHKACSAAQPFHQVHALKRTTETFNQKPQSCPEVSPLTFDHLFAFGWCSQGSKGLPRLKSYNTLVTTSVWPGSPTSPTTWLEPRRAKTHKDRGEATGGRCELVHATDLPHATDDLTGLGFFDQPTQNGRQNQWMTNGYASRHLDRASRQLTFPETVQLGKWSPVYVVCLRWQVPSFGA